MINKLTGDYFNRIGKPELLITDNATQFRSKKFHDTLAEYGVKTITTSVYFPQGNMVERANREIGRLLRALCHTNHKKWSYVIDQISTWINRAIHSSTGYSPEELHFGRTLSNPLLKHLELPPSTDPSPNMIVLAKRQLRSKAERRKLRHDHNNKKLITFKVGDKVLVKTHNQSSAMLDEIKKFFLLYHGPCTIKKLIHQNAYQVIDDSTGHSVGIQNVVNLIPYKMPVTNID